MSRLPDHVIDDIRARVDIVDVVSEYVTLKRAGRRYKGLCPFHTEKTPSFHVDRETQLFYCFGCQTGGNVFNFLTQLEKVSFGEAVRRLAERAGVPLEEIVRSPEEARRFRLREECFKANEIARDYFVRQLFSPQGVAARNYLKERGLSARSVKAYSIGFAPEGWHRLRDYLRTHNVSEEVAIKAGLLGRSQRGTVYDWFRGRIIFPIADVNGRVVGFGGRALGDVQPKYVNSPESPLFAKGLHLYGLNKARDGARSIQRILLVEGYMDVVGLYEHGYSPAVASLGTAFTTQQARMIKRFTQEVVLAFDADPAGRNAALRGLEILAEEGLHVRVAQLPEGDDPDSFIQREGKEAFARLVEFAIPLVEYRMIQALQGLDLERVEGQIEGVRRILPILSKIESAVGREGYLLQAAQLLGVTPAALSEELYRYMSKRSGERRDEVARSTGRSRHKLTRTRYTNRDLRKVGQTASVRAASNRQNEAPSRSGNSFGSVEGGLLAWLLRNPTHAQSVLAHLGENPFLDNRYNRIFTWVLEHGEGSGEESIVHQLNDPELAQVAGEVLLREEAQTAPFEAYLKRAVEEQLRRQIEGMEARISLLMRSDTLNRIVIDQLVLEYKKVRDRLKGPALAPSAAY